MRQTLLEDGSIVSIPSFTCPLGEMRRCSSDCMWLVIQGGMGFCAVASIAAKGAPNLSVNGIPVRVGKGGGE